MGQVKSQRPKFKVQESLGSQTVRSLESNAERGIENRVRSYTSKVQSPKPVLSPSTSLRINSVEGSKVLHPRSGVSSFTFYVLRFTFYASRFLSFSPQPRAYSLQSKGFTLIEIMVVVFILGLLVTLVAPKVMGRTDEAKRTKAAADLRAVQQALNLYRLDNGGYPTTDQGLQALVTKPQSGTVPQRWNSEGYLEKVQTDPWGHPYLYLSNGERYTLKSLGADGEEGGEGKYADVDSRDL